MVPFNILFPRLFIISLLPKGSVPDHRDIYLASWSITFCRLLKEDEFLDFQELLDKISGGRVIDVFDTRTWSLVGNGTFSVKPPKAHLSPSFPWTNCCIRQYGSHTAQDK